MYKISFGQAYNFICSDAQQAQLLQLSLPGHTEIRDENNVFFIPVREWENYKDIACALAKSHKNGENYFDVYEDKMRMLKFHADENKIDMLA